ncbi:ABC transporter substrate-binding protein [Mesorhizobium tianshanense]|uniref:Iron complex transport system substrate-binding protein n=1 Tax=Mesorhizobium tianshanense TaxID=39844 RepID=A0A562NV25_9HYPH|nr:ABC transporter substrate-binding protein [Mesorhizobium tianshanense]TWI36074.1 iron complex transport system substrate-binding protein [Mesorhizobium tianshanense]GLS39891.1 ABC transporter substrate-binding protein [Mesorhizobium tianshanense]
MSESRRRTETAAGSLTRRECVGAFAAAWCGVAPLPARAARPPRIACLEWTSAEMVISLGVGPVAVADTKGYRDWVVDPDLPAGCLDLGSRGEPNLELLTELRPDLIVGAYGYGLDEAPFKRIAPLHTVPFYDGTEAPYRQAETETLKLGAQLGREVEAQRLIHETAATIADLRAQFSGRADQPLAVVSMFDDRHVRVYGKGSLFQDVLDRLSLANAWTAPTDSWGFSTVGIEQLVAIGEARLISLDPIPPHVKIRIDQSSLWANLPCVKAGNARTIPPIWPFGGLAAAARFATFLARA